jgi:hypothetical protein
MDQYKLYEESTKVTGNNCRKFDYVEEMRDFMGKWVTVNPSNLISFGCISAVNLEKKQGTTDSYNNL